MASVMMRLGLYKFSMGTAAYQELTRSTSYRWARQERINTNDALQMTGLGPETIQLRGRVHGLWVIEEVGETQSTFAARGAPRKQEFDIKLTRYDGGLRALLPF